MTLVSPTVPSPGDEANASDISTPINQLATVINGGLDDTNISTISGSKIAAATVGTSQIADGSITTAKLATAAGEPGAAWASWTPTWSGLSIGNGTVVAKYSKQGKTVNGRITLTFGSTTSVSGDILFTLPATATAYAGTAHVTQIGGANIYDVSGPRVYQGVVNMASTTTASIRPQYADTAALYSLPASSVLPFTWATPDEIGLSFRYEAA